MKTIDSICFLVDRTHRGPLLACVIIVCLFPLFAKTVAAKNERDHNQASKNENPSESAAVAGVSKHTTRENKNFHDSIPNDSQRGSVKQSARDNEEDNSSALNSFLENVLKAQNEFKWIDQSARNINRKNRKELYLEERPSKIDSVYYGNKFRDKRDLDPNYETPWQMSRIKYINENSRDVPRKVYVSNDINVDDVDSTEKWESGKEISSVHECELDRPVYERGRRDDQALKDWFRTEHLRSSSDWTNSNKNLEPDENESEDRWISVHEPAGKRYPRIDINFDEGSQFDSNMRNQREASNILILPPSKESEYAADETKPKRKGPPLLQSLKETVLQLKKSLTKNGKKLQGNTNNADTVEVKESGRVEDGSREQKVNEKNKHASKGENIVEKSSWREDGGSTMEILDSEKPEGSPEDGSTLQKAWRTKRTEINDDQEETNPRVFYRAGFGSPYLEEKALKEFHDRRRRSKESSSKEKLNSKEARIKNKAELNDGLASPGTMAKETNCRDSCDAKTSNEPRGKNVFDEFSKPKGEHKENTRASVDKNRARLEAPRKDLDMTENKLNVAHQPTRNGKGCGNLEGNSLRTLGLARNELQDASIKTSAGSRLGREEIGEAGMQKTEEKQENAGPSQGEQVIKVFEPQGHLYQNSELTKEVERIEPDEEDRRKLSRRLSEEKKPKEEPRNFNILVKSENKNLLKLSNAVPRQVAACKGGPENSAPLIINAFDVKKKLIIEKEDKPGKSVSTILDLKIEKTEIDSSVKNNRQERNDKAVVPNIEKKKPRKKSYRDALGTGRTSIRRDVDQQVSKKSPESNEEETRVDDGVDFTRRKLLQYLEYSNDDGGDSDLNYSDNQESEIRDRADDNDASKGTRKERYVAHQGVNPTKAKVNVLIKEKIDRKSKKHSDYMRMRRDPINIIEYYDYDTEQQDHDGPFLNSEQQRIQINRDQSSIHSGMRPGSLRKLEDCGPTMKKQNENEDAVLKEECKKSKVKNNLPKEKFVVDLSHHKPGNLSEKLVPRSSSESKEEEKSSSNQQPGSSDQGEDNANGINRGRLNQRVETRDGELLSDREKYIEGDGGKLILEEPVEYIMNMGEKLDPGTIEDFLEDVRSIEQRKYPGNEISLEKLQEQRLALPSRDLEENNQPKNNYLALKSTDDMFKGGDQQSNSTEKKLLMASAGRANAQYETQKANKVRDDKVPEKVTASPSSKKQGHYVDTDSSASCDNGYLESKFSQKDVDEKQTAIDSKDLYESFVEPMDWIDDFDEDAKTRHGRGLKTVEIMNFNSMGQGNRRESAVDLKNFEYNQDNASSKMDDTGFAGSVKNFFDNPKFRAKRALPSPDRIFYDDLYDYPKNATSLDNRFEDIPSYDYLDNPDKFSDLNYRLPRQYNSEHRPKPRKLRKIVRSANNKRKKKHSRRHKLSDKDWRRYKKKDRGKRKRRHHKEYARSSKSKQKLYVDNRKKEKKLMLQKNHLSRIEKSRDAQSESKIHSNHRKRDKYQMPTRNNRKVPHGSAANELNIEDDLERKKIAQLLAADNIEDESQMDMAVHGELGGKIVEEILQQVQKNEGLKRSLGPGLYQKLKPYEIEKAEKKYRQSLNANEEKHTNELMKKVMVLLNRLILDEVQEKTCLSLSPDSRDFLNWMLDVNRSSKKMRKETSPASLMYEPSDITTQSPQDKFLFEASSKEKLAEDTKELSKKIGVMENLIAEYNALTEKEKDRVQTVHDYLVKQLDLMVEYIDTMEKGSSYAGKTVKRKEGSVFEYDFGTSNVSNGSYAAEKNNLSPERNVQNLSKRSNLPFEDEIDSFLNSDIDLQYERQREIRSSNRNPGQRERRRNHKKRKRQHRKRRKNGSNIDQSSRYKNVPHETAILRRKRAYSHDDIWNPFESGYEEPLTYSSIDVRNINSKENIDDIFEKEKKLGDKTAEKARYQVQELAKRAAESGHESLTSLDPVIISYKEQDIIPVKGKNQAEDELLLLNKRQAWKKQNEEQLEEVAFGNDMRKKLREKELFVRLTEIDKRKKIQESDTKRQKKKVEKPTDGAMLNVENNVSPIISSEKPGGNNSNENDPRNSMEINVASLQKMGRNSTWKYYTPSGLNNSNGLSSEDKLRLLEEKINVYSDNDHDTSRVREDARTTRQKVREERATGDAEVGNHGVENREETLNVDYEMQLKNLKTMKRSSRG